MARKSILEYELLTNHSLSTSFLSPITTISYLDNASYQINCTTTDSIGTFSLLVSDDYQIDLTTNTVTSPGNFNPLVLGGGTPSVNANNTVITISLNQLSFKAIQVAYTSSTPGTGTCSIYLAAKQLSG